MTLPKIPRKGGMEKLLKGGGNPKKGEILQERGECCIFSSWGVANVITVTFNYIVFLFPLNVGVSPSFHSTVVVPVCRVYTSCFYNTVVSSCYRLHTSCLHHGGVTSCFSLNMWF